MGKEAGDQRQRQRSPDGGDGGGGAQGSGHCYRGKGVVQLQWVAALVLGTAMLFSALFWLLPFAPGRAGKGRADAPDLLTELSAVIATSAAKSDGVAVTF
ncbi:hypothetical protein D1007_01483 [Hordeum vulgare]|nr:hypothetical protein D1007_01483 [Hordeum vulgare]